MKSEEDNMKSITEELKAQKTSGRDRIADGTSTMIEKRLLQGSTSYALNVTSQGIFKHNCPTLRNRHRSKPTDDKPDNRT